MGQQLLGVRQVAGIGRGLGPDIPELEADAGFLAGLVKARAQGVPGQCLPVLVPDQEVAAGLRPVVGR